MGKISTKIFVMTHRKFEAPAERIYIPLHVGKALNQELGYIGDNTGNHISEKNCYYSELTGLYWAAKNVMDADYMGLCHYRRFFLNENGEFLKENECEKILKEYDVILPRAVYHPKSYYEVYKEAHNIYDLDVTGGVLKELYPDDYENFQRIINDNKVYSGNLFVASAKHFREYTDWLFSIFDYVEQRIHVEEYDSYHKRVFGFLSEQLLYVWVKSRGLKIYEMRVGLTQEKAETVELKQQIREKIKEGTLEGIQNALMRFRQTIQDRPDLMLQGSDLTGELADMFRILYICEQELSHEQTGMLYISKDINVLIKHYHVIERILLHILNGTLSQEEADYFQDAKVTSFLVQILINNNQILKKEEEKLWSCLS